MLSFSLSSWTRGLPGPPQLLSVTGCASFLLSLRTLQAMLPVWVIFIVSPSALCTVYIFCLFCLWPLSIHCGHRAGCLGNWYSPCTPCALLFHLPINLVYFSSALFSGSHLLISLPPEKGQSPFVSDTSAPGPPGEHSLP